MDKSIHTRQYRILIGIVREEREKRQVTQQQLASRLGVQQAVVSKIENCERRIDVLELRQICVALGVSLSYIINVFEERLSL
ncbi:MAG: helix-turn-helix domain-containing protein [Prevotella sp.]|nr:helix-turn-helix domain-containing protein [Prevotella sp.]